MQMYERNSDNDLNLHSVTELNVGLASLQNTVCHSNICTKCIFYNVNNRIKSKLEHIIKLT